MGQIVGAAAAKNIKPCTLELGGKSAAIVWKDVDVDKVPCAALRRIAKTIVLGRAHSARCVLRNRITKRPAVSQRYSNRSTGRDNYTNNTRICMPD